MHRRCTTRTPGRARAIALFLTAVLCAMAAGLAQAYDVGQLIYSRNTLYHRVFVSQRGSVMTLQFGNRDPSLMQSQVDLSNLRRQMHEYSMLTFASLLYKPEPKRLLVIGLGGGVIPREMSHYCPELRVDVVEIDPEIPAIAERYFGFHAGDRIKVHVMDGRVFVRKQLREDPVPKYDIVVLDAFNSDYIPFHLMTREFLQQVKGVLADDGVVAANVFYTNRLFDAELATFHDVFETCQSYMGARSTNAILIAGGPQVTALTLAEAHKRSADVQERLGLAFDMRTVVAARLRPQVAPDSTVRVLTDDRAPVNRLRSQPRL